MDNRGMKRKYDLPNSFGVYVPFRPDTVRWWEEAEFLKVRNERSGCVE
jgi:hypothetical protein